jgi:RNA polymerase primary sigma factor
MTDDDIFESRSLQQYLEQISKFPALSEEEEKELARRIQEGDREALQRLVESNLRFVVNYAKKYRGMGLGMLDLIHEGNLGLIEAAKRFDPNRNVRFVSYAVWWIRQAILHALTQNARAFHIPQKLSDQISLMRRKEAELKAELGREPTREEIAEALGITPEEVDDFRILAEKNISLSNHLPDSDQEVEEMIKDEVEPSVEYQIIRNAIEQQVRDLLQELDEKEALVLRLRFGLDNNQPMTLQEIGDILNLTRERIRQIELKAKRKLAQSHRLQQLRGYLN